MFLPYNYYFNPVIYTNRVLAVRDSQTIVIERDLNSNTETTTILNNREIVIQNNSSIRIH